MYATTRTRPIPPASRPPRNWSLPSVGETVCAVDWVNVSGSAPYFSVLARSVADCWVKLPLTWVVPLMVDWIRGADTTCPSSTNAT